MTTPTEILVNLLARQDAAHSAMRSIDWGSRHAATNRHEARKALAAGGLLWKSEKRSEAKQKAAQRALADCSAAELIEATGSGQALRIRLTTKGQWVARAAAGQPNRDAGHASAVEVDRLAHLAVGDDVGRFGRLVSERWLAKIPMDVPVDGKALEELGLVDLLARPALAAGWLVTKSMGDGNAWYQLTDLGAGAIREPEPVAPCQLPEYDPAAGELYHDTYTEARARLRSEEPEVPQEMGELPLPCSLDIRLPAPKGKR